MNILPHLSFRRLPNGHQRRPLWQVAILSCAFLFASGVLDGQNTAFAVTGSIEEPDEGEEFEEEDNVTIRVMGDADTEYTILLMKDGSTQAGKFNLETNSEGEWTTTLSGLTEGDYTIKLREGHDNISGSSLDTVGFTVNGPPV